ncbi:hypothetical protein [Bacillus sp. KH172YL63]|uniref:hypothetical protein n=1 Tax=Bacillus sp. KH172YL63 TaxID=2709784 RepID=UPI0013E4E18F|nr:hypothetical protein [Bacillus sp. KH172YL63]BCB04055.1 hypothetical protein KH172YL63_21880 [Bacillus sp. KH172YL63]
MKKFFAVTMTILIEAGLLGLVAFIFGWRLLDVLFIGGLLIFGAVWLYLLFINQSNNVHNTSIKGWTGQDAGEVKQFQFRFTPITLGLILFMVINLGITVFYYAT